MEVADGSKLQSSRLGGLSNAQVRTRSLKQFLELPHKQRGVVFDPYSSAMDKIPLKGLFPDVKAHKRPLERKVETLDSPSPQSRETEDSIRNKLRNSLATALRVVEITGFVQNPDREEDEARSQHITRPASGQVKGEVRERDFRPGRRGDMEGLMDDSSSFLMNTAMCLEETEEPPFRKTKVEAHNTETERANLSHVSELVMKVSAQIEAELFRYFGGVNKKYKERARSLLFNLKDRSNPDLRSRVLSGEILPRHLCAMNAEQLASKELSQWRIAKAEALADMVVLADEDTEPRRLVKKTHKGEFEVKVEKADFLTEGVTGNEPQKFALGTEQKTEEYGAGVHVGLFDRGMDDVLTASDTGVLNFSPIRGPISVCGLSAVDHAYDLNHEKDLDKNKESQELLVGPNMNIQENMDKDDCLPVIMSLDEYIGSRNEPLVSALKAEEEKLMSGMNIRAASNLTKIFAPLQNSVGPPKVMALESGSTENGSLCQRERKEHKTHDKLWEGCFQLSGCQISPVLAFYKSGDGVQLQCWPELVEIKGRVRLDALEKFLQELHLSRTRSIMVIVCRVDGQAENGASMDTMKEAANQYRKGERVGYAEPAPGFELYLFPGGGTALNLLIEHGYLSLDQAMLEEESSLIGFVVCRRSATNVTYKTSSHYFNANRHALSGQLASPTRLTEVQVAKGTLLKSELQDKKAIVSFPKVHRSISVLNSKHEDHVVPRVTSIYRTFQHLPTKPSESETILPCSTQGHQDPRSCKSKVPQECPQKDLKEEDDSSDDIPPGFGPKVMAMIRPGIEQSSVQDDDDDDDLPEFSFATEVASPLVSKLSKKSPGVPRRSATVVPQSLQFQVPSFSQGSISCQIPQIPQLSFVRSGPFEKPNALNQSSYYPAHGPSEQINPSWQSPQVFQPSYFLESRPRPPPVPPPVQLFNVLSPRPHLSGDGSFVPGRPNIAQTTAPAVSCTEQCTEQKDAFCSSSIQPSLAQPHGDPSRVAYFCGGFQEQRIRADFSGVPSYPNSGPVSLNTLTSMNLRQCSRTQASQVWDDDEMPEWCPPALVQQETPQVRDYHKPALPFVEARGPAKQTSETPMSHRTVVPPSMGQGWQGMQPQISSEMKKGNKQAEQQISQVRASAFQCRSMRSEVWSGKAREFNSNK